MSALARSMALLSMLTLPSLTAEARIEVSPPDDPMPLRLQGSQVRDLPNVVVIQQEDHLIVPQPSPGGCFNCGTLLSNEDRLAHSLARSHAFSEGLFKRGGQRIILLRP